MGVAIVAAVAITLGVAAWNFYVAFLFLPLAFTIGVFGFFGVTFARNLRRGSRPGPVSEPSAQDSRAQRPPLA